MSNSITMNLRYLLPLLNFETLNLGKFSYIWPLLDSKTFELKLIFLYLAFIRFMNFELRTIFICFAYIILDGTLNLDQFSYVLPLLN
jgi:hypothetical protein